MPNQDLWRQIVIIEYLTGILVFVTAIYAYLTFRMVKASEASVEAVREQSEAMLRPYFTIGPFVRPHTPFLYLRIKNSGQTAARNLRLSMDRDFYQFGKSNQPHRNLRIATAFSTPIDSFPPGAELLFGLGQGWVLFGKDANEEVTPVQFTITATYEFGEKQTTEEKHIDLRPYIGTEGERDPLVEELERIRKIMEGAK